MRSWIVPVWFCLFFFLIPLQCFIIGHGMGVGIQGAVYRYQITTNGESFIPVTTEFAYVTAGTITGKTAFSIILWTIGTLLMMILTTNSLLLWERLQERQLLLLIKGAVVAGLLYILALCTQYGFLLNGPAGNSYPFGILIMFISLVAAYYYRDWILETTLPVNGISPDLD